MEQIGPVRPDLIKGYIEGKKAYEQVFPKIYELIAERVETALRPKYPRIDPVVGPRDKARVMAKFPEMGEDVPIDWVAFGFSGMDMYDYHIGILLQVHDWPVKYLVGLHIMDLYITDHALELVRSEVDAIDWKKAVGLDPTYVYDEAVREHRWLDPVQELDFANIDDEIEKIAQRAIKYYEASAAAADVLSAALAGEK